MAEQTCKTMTLDERKTKIKKLVELFKKGLNQHKSKVFNEAQTRKEFIDPLLKCLGWDVGNEKEAHPNRREVIVEDRQKIGGTTKHPDYTLRIGGQAIFYVEAKQPSVNLKIDPEPALQVRRYAYTAKMAISVLTDFEELAIYDARIKPSAKDSAGVARIRYYNYEEYEQKFEEIYNLIGFDAVDCGSLDTFIENATNIKGTASVDDDILKMIEQWRILIAEDIALHNEEIDEFNLTGCVQKIIDRLIFLRICEDKDIEQKDQLKKIITDKEDATIYEKLKKLFVNANEKFNAGLFATDEYLDSLNIQDKTITKIINALYYPECQYEFSVLPVEILGSIYERFLGKIIRFTRKTKDGHSIIIEEKPEVQKAGGVFYTPDYIVRYIVSQTIGKKIKGKTPEQISEMRFVDPACGSGSFLVGAFQYLLDWHLEYYENTKNLDKAEKENKIYKDATTHEYKLSVEEKKRILLNNIYGVDIDAQAVEVTKLSLFLKLLENEGQALSEGRRDLFKASDMAQKKILPYMGDNIKCGNSLIGSDYYEGRLDLDLEEQRKVNAFDWEFRAIDNGELKIENSGKFDCVIGNPPYVRVQTLNESYPESLEYYNRHYKDVVTGNYDLYLLFIFKGMNLLKKDGLLGFIQPHKFFSAEMGFKLRKILKEKTAINKIIDFSTNQVFENATTYTCLLFLENSVKKEFDYKRFELGEDFNQLENLRFDKISYEKLADDGWIFQVGKTDELIQKLKTQKYEFEDIASKVFKGSSTGNDKIFLFDLIQEKKNTFVVKSELSTNAVEIEKDILRKFLYGESVRRYQSPTDVKYLLFPYKKSEDKYILIEASEMKKSFPLAFGYLSSFKNVLMARKIPLTKDNFYKYSAARSLNEYEQPKILIPDMLVSNRISFDEKGEYFTGPAIHCPILSDIGKQFSEKVLLAILNSNLFWFFISHTSTALRGNAYRLTPEFITKFSFPDLTNPKFSTVNSQLSIICSQMLTTKAQLSGKLSDSDRKLLEQRCEILDKNINTIVYQLYGLTDDEIAIVEGK